MLNLKPTQIRGLEKLADLLDSTHRKADKALSDAIRGTAYKLRVMMQDEVRKGVVGGRRLKPLSMIGRYTRYRGADKPLYKMAKAIRYWVKSADPVEVHIGWTGPSISKRWKRIARAHQEGFESPIHDPRRKYFRETGKRLAPRSKFRKYFFLKKTTTKFKTPARPIIDPFWNAHERWSKDNVRNFFKIKMAGGKF